MGWLRRTPEGVRYGMVWKDQHLAKGGEGPYLTIPPDGTKRTHQQHTMGWLWGDLMGWHHVTTKGHTCDTPYLGHHHEHNTTPTWLWRFLAWHGGGMWCSGGPRKGSDMGYGLPTIALLLGGHVPYGPSRGTSRGPEGVDPPQIQGLETPDPGVGTPLGGSQRGYTPSGPPWGPPQDPPLGGAMGGYPQRSSAKRPPPR